MHVLSLFRWGAPLEAPVLTLITGSADNTPDFVLTGDLAELDTVRFSYGTASDFTGATETTNAIDAAEDAANALDFATGTLANNTWYFRARIERPPNPTISGWSNTETITLTGATSQGSVRSLFGRWLGGFGANNGTAGYRSLFGRWLGGFGAAPPPPTDVVRGGPAGRHFSRKRWKELLEAIAAQEALERKAAEVTGKRREALERAARAADALITSVEDEETAEHSRELVRLRIAMEAATSAAKVADVVKRANAVAAYAKQMADDEEEEAVMFLMLQ